jgi:hypothetical protein
VTPRKLAIQAALVDNYNRYAQGLDSKDWQLVRSCFAEKVCIDYGELSASGGAPDVPRRADDWLGYLQSVINRFDVTRHTITNHRFVIDGATVSCRAYLSADHVKFTDPSLPVVGPGDSVMVVGEYTNYYAEHDARWLIVRSELVVNYSVGNVALFAG